MSPCRCGHTAAIHEHYRGGTDCAARGCGCPRYRRTLRAHAADALYGARLALGLWRHLPRQPR